MPLSSGSPACSTLRSALVAAVLACATLAAGAHQVGERQLKAEMIVRMLRLVTWRTTGPADPTAALAIVVVGDAALADALREASVGQRVDGRALGVSGVPSLTLLPASPPPVVVLAASQRASAPALVRAVEPKGVLTIGEGEGMGQAGLVIGVYVDGDRIRFDANTGAAARAGITLSSHLLRLARIVG
ncbi:hypothetical protein TBR22_A17100 [Luteitalea sp. TBR-22]|uniref:YfiR family protein n=1 Tax=Luteitalea sp. TBR-22 TaxID=2802971 RepID=UPI001AFBCB0C|nr:YfiR family protein [Luteitalea sp. TBR-22]BCS32495.1 hypothetical protein TBR22_A17100 [Luteitalea sp. TBR-22]